MGFFKLFCLAPIPSERPCNDVRTHHKYFAALKGSNGNFNSIVGVWGVVVFFNSVDKNLELSTSFLFILLTSQILRPFYSLD